MKMIQILLLAVAAATAWADSDIKCKESFADKVLDSIRSKLPFTAPPTLEQLSDQSRPTEEQQVALIELDRRKIRCANALVKELSDAPSEALIIFNSAVTKEQAARADLYLGKITFGEYNKTVAQLGAAMDQQLAAIEQRQALADQQRRAAITRGAAAGARQALPVYNPFPKPLICTSTRRGTLVDTYCR